MTRDSTVLPFQHPEEVDDPLTSVLREGARRLLAQAVEAEAEAFLATMREERLADGRARLVRHGHGPERTIQTGIGPVPVRRVKVRDRGAETAPQAERITFTSAILPKWARRTKSLDALLPVLYLRGISTGDFQEALAALVGKDAPNLSPSVIGRLKEEWQSEYERWQRRDLGSAIRLRLGRRGLPAGPDGRRCGVHAGSPGGDAGRQEGTRRLPCRRARERAKLARAARRPQGSRSRHRTVGRYAARRCHHVREHRCRDGGRCRRAPLRREAR